MRPEYVKVSQPVHVEDEATKEMLTIDIKLLKLNVSSKWVRDAPPETDIAELINVP